MTNIEGYDTYSMLVRQCVRQLLEDKICYCFKDEHVEDIRKRMLKKYNEKIHIEKNECGYTLSIGRKYEKRRIN